MVDDAVLKNLVPINALSGENLAELAAAATIEECAAGQRLFEEGQSDHQAIYVLAGEVVLSSRTTSFSRRVAAGTDEARYALAHLKPRQYTGTAQTPVTIARVDGVLLDRLLTWDQAAGYEVTEIEGADGEWMWRMLRSAPLARLPPANANALFSRLEPIAVKAGQIIIKQEDPGSYYYIVKSGRANVARKSPGGKVAILGELREGDGFGEEALLSGAPRNATVVMSREGVLMRLAKKDFEELLQAPLVKWVVAEEARGMVRAGAGLIDVRLEEESRAGSIKGGINVPLALLRNMVHALDAKRRYIVFCDTGSRSAAAAFLLNQRGFDVYVLRGGLDALLRRE